MLRGRRHLGRTRASTANDCRNRNLPGSGFACFQANPEEASAIQFARPSTFDLRACAVQRSTGSGSFPTPHRSSLSASQQALSAGSPSVCPSLCSRIASPSRSKAGYSSSVRDDQRAVQDRTDPQGRAMENARGGGDRHAELGVLVQPSSIDGGSGLHPAGRSRGKLIPVTHRAACLEGLTTCPQPASANPGAVQSSFCSGVNQ